MCVRGMLVPAGIGVIFRIGPNERTCREKCLMHTSYLDSFPCYGEGGSISLANLF